jgi:putative tricarboxylic transport membrane protein
MDFSSILYVFTPGVLLVISLGVVGGIIIGAIPGLTATMGVALLIPMTFSMSPSPD